MSKQEFINILRTSLNGQVPSAVVSENVTYYEDYINSQIRMGRTEQEVLQSLGNPRLIAKSIIDASKAVGQGSKNKGDTDFGYRQNAGQKSSRRFKLPIWLVLLLVFFTIFLIIGIVMRLLFFLAPLIMVAFLIVFLVKLFRDWLN